MTQQDALCRCNHCDEQELKRLKRAAKFHEKLLNDLEPTKDSLTKLNGGGSFKIETPDVIGWLSLSSDGKFKDHYCKPGCTVENCPSLDSSDEIKGDFAGAGAMRLLGLKCLCLEQPCEKDHNKQVNEACTKSSDCACMQPKPDPKEGDWRVEYSEKFVCHCTNNRCGGFVPDADPCELESFIQQLLSKQKEEVKRECVEKIRKINVEAVGAEGKNKELVDWASYTAKEMSIKLIQEL